MLVVNPPLSTRYTLAEPLLDSTLFFHGSTSFSLTLLPSTIVLLHSTWVCIAQQCLYFIPFDFTAFYHGSTTLYLTLHYTIRALHHPTSLYKLSSTMALLHCMYLTLHCSSMALLRSSWLYCVPPWLYLTQPCFTMPLLHFTWLYITLCKRLLYFRWTLDSIDHTPYLAICGSAE